MTPSTATDSWSEAWTFVFERMLQARPILSRSGSLAQKRVDCGPVTWAIRYRERLPDGRVVQRAIQLGRDPEVVKRARFLLNQWQLPRKPQRSNDPLVSELWEIWKQHQAYYPPRIRRYYLRHLRAAGDDPRAMLAAAFTWDAARQAIEPIRAAPRPRQRVAASNGIRASAEKRDRIPGPLQTTVSAAGAPAVHQPEKPQAIPGFRTRDTQPTAREAAVGVDVVEESAAVGRHRVDRPA